MRGLQRIAMQALANGRAQVTAGREQALPDAPAQIRFRSKAEARYAQQLEAQRLAGQIRAWSYEPITVTLATAAGHRARFTPDFGVRHMDDSIEMREVKGHMREAARVRLLLAVQDWPCFRWSIVWARRGGFEREVLR